jgi:hypothetical protein
MAMVAPGKSGAKPMAQWNATEPELSGLAISPTCRALKFLTESGSSESRPVIDAHMALIGFL